MLRSGFSGAQYFTRGFQLVRQKGVRSLVIMPLIINFLLLSSATAWLIFELQSWKEDLYQSAWGWVQWLLDNLGWLLWPVVTLILIVAVFYFFAIVANWIAAPFNGLLSEAVERQLAGDTYQDESISTSALIKEIPRLFAREWQKFAYWLPKALGCLILFFIPGLNIIAPIVWLVFGAWMMSVQYIDYPMDNHKVSFQTMLEKLRSTRGGAMGFGGMVMLFTLIPVVNILVMPVAVAGATALWYEQYRN